MECNTYMWMPSTLMDVWFILQGKLYLLTENFSQLYRMLVPVPLWLAYFTDYNYGGEYFALIATTIYVLLKVTLYRSSPFLIMRILNNRHLKVMMKK